MRTAIAMILIAIAWMGLRPSNALSGVPVFLFALSVVSVLTTFGQNAQKGDLESDQIKDDKSAQAAADAFVSEKHADAPSPKADKKYILFLRTFATDAKFKVYNPRVNALTNLIPLYFLVAARRVPLDDALRVLVGRKISIFAIGAPEDVYGAGKVRTSDDNWKKYFDALATNASAIILFAGMRPGTMWEIERIAESPEFQQKTVIVFPPKNWSFTVPDETQDILKYLESVGVDCSICIKPGHAALIGNMKITHTEKLITDTTPEVKRGAFKSLLARVMT